MGRTIIQPIGPLYGEDVNGTVFGRPNGSIYVPPTNTISAVLAEEYIKKGSNGWLLLCNSSGVSAITGGIKISASSQDNLAYIKVELSDDSDFGNIIATRDYSAGMFNIVGNNVLWGENEVTIVSETTYYYHAVLVASTGVPIATSETKELTGWVAE